MDVVIAGGHGKIALLLAPLLVRAGHHPRGLVRNPEHAGDLRVVGAEPVLCDLETLSAEEIAEIVGASDAFVFAAGAGPGSGPQRKWTMDYAGAVKGMQACRLNGIDRYVMVSAISADPEAPDDGGFGTYLRAKGQADQKLRDSGLDGTIVRPGRLTDGPGTGRVRADVHVGGGEIPRADVAAVLAAVLDAPATAGVTFEVVSGETPAAEAVAALAA